MPGLLVLRSLTKTWGLAGVRAGYVVGDAALVARLAGQQPPWSVSSLALVALEACLSPDALAQGQALATTEEQQHRDHLLAGLAQLPVRVVLPPEHRSSSSTPPRNSCPQPAGPGTARATRHFSPSGR